MQIIDGTLSVGIALQREPDFDGREQWLAEVRDESDLDGVFGWGTTRESARRALAVNLTCAVKASGQPCAAIQLVYPHGYQYAIEALAGDHDA